ncbi:MAG: transglutaminase domain-containing protein [Verrucomicrobia bacterium]|nr:transglutaminase domain-containing protein [Verrucomicrobiota bacterium]
MKNILPIAIALFVLIAVSKQALGAIDTAPTSLRAYVENNQRRQAYGVYLKNHKFGWAIDELRLHRDEGKEVAVSTFEMQGSFISGGEKARFEDRSVTHFDLTGKGQIIYGEERTMEDGNEVTRIAVREGDAMVLTTRSGGGETKRRIPVPKETLQSIRDLEAWLSGPPKKGARFQSYSTSWNEEKIDTKEVYQYRGKKSILWGGVRTSLHLVDVNIEGMVVAFEVLPDGTPLKGMLGGLFELRAEEEPIARMPGTASFDMLEASAIKVDKDLGDPAKLESLTLRITGFGNRTMPVSHRQRIKSRRGQTLTLELSRDRPADKPVPLTSAARAEFLKPTPTIQSDDEALRNQAEEIAGGEPDVLWKARRLQTWIYTNVRQTTAANASSALDVLRNRAGDCTELTLLFVALARAAGIPAREVGGVMYVNEGTPLFGWHAWAEIHDGRQWVGVDPTWNQVYVDAAHLKLSEDSNDWAWVNLLGRMKISVVQFSGGN